MAAPDTLQFCDTLALPALFGVEETGPDPCPDPDEELWIDSDSAYSVYRSSTIRLLRKYFRFSIEIGRLPSLVGREYFRSRITSARTPTFEDAVIFAHDVDRCLAQLDDYSQHLIARVILQEYDQEEAARLLRCTDRTIRRLLPAALDQLSQLFVERGLL